MKSPWISLQENKIELNRFEPWFLWIKSYSTLNLTLTSLSYQSGAVKEYVKEWEKNKKKEKKKKAYSWYSLWPTHSCYSINCDLFHSFKVQNKALLKYIQCSLGTHYTEFTANIHWCFWSICARKPVSVFYELHNLVQKDSSTSTSLFS